MGWKSTLIKPIARQNAREIQRLAAKACVYQKQIFSSLIKKAANTTFGKDHGFSTITTHADYVRQVPIRDYEGLRPYVDQIRAGKSDVLWPGKPRYFAKTSGTTSGVKYIPLTKASLPNHFGTARKALFNYAVKHRNFSFLDGKVIFLSGSPEMADVNGIPTGRLSGIVNHLVPAWLRSNQLPSYPTNCIVDWESKLTAIVEETLGQDMRLISGIPPWVQMYYERLLEVSQKPDIKSLFPNYSIFVYGGVNFEPYRQSLENLVGGTMDSLETYPASEGFIAFQDCWPHEGLLLNANAGIFYEFVPAHEIFSEQPTRLSLEEVELGVNYALIINSNAGLWGYNLGDTVQFVSKNPYRLVVSGRIKHFISAFGEHVIGKEVERAMEYASKEVRVMVREFTVAPQVNPPEGGTPYHEWFIEFNDQQTDLEALAKRLDESMQEQNIYYRDLIEGGILQPLKIKVVQENGFRSFMKLQGKLGGQNKVPRLSNDRKIAEALIPFSQ